MEKWTPFPRPQKRVRRVQKAAYKRRFACGKHRLKNYSQPKVEEVRGELGYTEILQQRAGSLNVKRLLLIKGKPGISS